MTLPTDRVTATMMGEIKFGNMCLNIMCIWLAPTPSAAITNSRCLRLKVAPRTKRATVVQPTNATIIIIGNLVILIIGGLFFRLVVQKKPLFKFNFKFKSKKSASEEEFSFDDSNEKSKNGRKSNDSDEILNLSISDD